MENLQCDFCGVIGEVDYDDSLAAIDLPGTDLEEITAVRWCGACGQSEVFTYTRPQVHAVEVA